MIPFKKILKINNTYHIRGIELFPEHGLLCIKITAFKPLFYSDGTMVPHTNIYDDNDDLSVTIKNNVICYKKPGENEVEFKGMKKGIFYRFITLGGKILNDTFTTSRRDISDFLPKWIEAPKNIPQVSPYDLETAEYDLKLGNFIGKKIDYNALSYVLNNDLYQIPLTQKLIEIRLQEISDFVDIIAQKTVIEYTDSEDLKYANKNLELMEKLQLQNKSLLISVKKKISKLSKIRKVY